MRTQTQESACIENKMISFRQFLIELFDKPWHSIRMKEVEAKLNSNRTNGGTNHEYHKLENNTGFLHSFHKNGYIEIHHTSSNGMSGTISNIASGKHGANPRFYSTVIHHAKQHLDKGHGVKIVDPEHLLTHYRTIINKFKQDYHIEHNSDHILIRPHKKEIEEIFKSIQHLISSDGNS